MASSLAARSANRICFSCMALCTSLRQGWQLAKGGHALLCDNCGTLYDEGNFCNVFHVDSTGWRECISCRKPIHCGCIMSKCNHMLMDFGGVKCLECAEEDDMEEEDPYLTPFFDVPGDLHNMPGQPQVGNYGAAPIVPLGYGSPNAVPNETNTESILGAPAHAQAPSPAVGEHSLVNLDDISSSSRGKTPIGIDLPEEDTAGWTDLYHQNSLMMFDWELQKMNEDSSSVLIPLVEKVLTLDDADLKTGCLVLPEKYAEAYFPKISEPKGITLEVQDTRGIVWEFKYGFGTNCNQKIYVLEGLGGYMTLMQLKSGDTVTFYRMEPEGKLVIGFQKAGASTSGQKSLS